MFTIFSEYMAARETRWFFGLTGVLLVLAALTIFVFPEILAFLLATILLWAGIVLIGLALRKPRRAPEQSMRYEYYETF